MDEDKINLAPVTRMIARLLGVVVRRWHVVLGSVVIALLAITVMSAFEPKSYEALAGVAIIRTRTQVSLDSQSQVKTLSGEELGEGYPKALGQAYLNAQIVDPEIRARRASLVSLVKNGDIAERVSEQLSEKLSPVERQSSILARMVEGRIAPGPDKDAQNSDVIQIAVTSANPEKAALIANAWGRIYETMVNDVYGSPPSQAAKIQRDADAAKAGYDNAQKALIDFRAQSRTAETKRQIDERESVLRALTLGRTRVISTTINLEVESNSKLYQAFVEAESANRLLGFSAEQERKHKVLSAYLDSLTRGRVNVITKQATERERVLDDAYAALAKVDNQLRQARMLRDKASGGGEPATSSLALGFLTTDAAGTEFPEGLDLSLESVADLLSKDLARDSQALVDALERERADIEMTIQQQTQRLRTDEGLSLDQPSSQSQRDEAILKEFADLFQPGALGKLSEDLAKDNALKDASNRAAQDILQLRGNEDVLSFLSADTPLNRKINELEQEIRDLQATLERDNGLDDDLLRARDLAAASYSSLSLKAIETGLAERLPGTEVRFAASAPVPGTPKPTGRTITMVVAAILALIAGIGAAVALEERARAKRGQSMLARLLVEA